MGVEKQERDHRTKLNWKRKSIYDKKYITSADCSEFSNPGQVENRRDVRETKVVAPRTSQNA